MASFHNWTGDEEIDTQVPQFLNDDNAATQEKLDTKFNNSLEITGAADLNNFKDEGFYCCNSNSRAETILNCPTNYAFGLMVWGKGEIVYQEVREYNRSSKNQDYNNCWRRSYYSESGQGVWSKWQQMSYKATTLAGYGITDGMGKNVANSVGVPDFLKSNSNTSYLRLAGGDTFNKSATLQLYGGIHTTNAGQFLLNAADSAHSAVLSGSPSGILKWNNKNIVRSVNNVAADENGNVNITVDAELSDTSTNPVQNKAVKTGMDTLFESVMDRLAIVSDNIPTKVSTLENDAGYLTQHQSLDNYAKTNQDNNFSALQTFPGIRTSMEDMLYQWNTTTPTGHCGFMIVSANTTIDLSKIFETLPKADYMAVYTCFIQASRDYSLTITGVSKIFYIGSASDCSIKAPGVLLNVLCWRSGEQGQYTSACVSVSACS